MTSRERRGMLMVMHGLSGGAAFHVELQNKSSDVHAEQRDMRNALLAHLTSLPQLFLVKEGRTGGRGGGE